MCRHNCAIEPDDGGIMSGCSDYKPNTSYNKFIFGRLQEPNLRYYLYMLIEKHILFRDYLKEAEEFWGNLENLFNG